MVAETTPPSIHRLGDLARVMLGVACALLVLAWAIPTVPTLLGSRASSPVVRAESPPPSSVDDPPAAVVADDVSEVSIGAEDTGVPLPVVGTRPLVQPRVDGTAFLDIDTTDRTVTDMGCADGLDAASLDAYFGSKMGPLVGWDNPHIYPIDEHRTLWIAHDSYVDHAGTARNINDTRPQIQNVVFLQEGRCFTLVHGGTVEDWNNFENGDGHDNYERFLWPLGGQVVGETFWLFWAETLVADQEAGLFGAGITRYPTKTWLASYDVRTLERLSFDEAPNSGVFPTWGFAVESDDEYSYLFGNTNLLNLAREGGFDNGPHSATKMFVGRVPLGRLDVMPEYWNGSTWTDDAFAAAVISERFWTENTMQPRYLAGRWVSVVKRDGFFGNEIVVDVAENAWGPWKEVERIAYETRSADIPKNSYHPVLVPWSSPENGLIIVVSENAQYWDLAVQSIDLYRPAVIRADWPFPDDIGGGDSGSPDSTG